jgi:hypothetical protein
MKKSVKILIAVLLILTVCGGVFGGIQIHTYLQDKKIAEQKAEEEQKKLDEQKKVLGQWWDSTKTSGYLFKEDGSVTITAFKLSTSLPIVGDKINASYEGVYTLKNDSVTISYSILGAETTNTYRYAIESGNTLRFTDAQGETLVFFRAQSAE